MQPCRVQQTARCCGGVAVDGVAEHRRAAGREMDADLVRAPGLGPGGDERASLRHREASEDRPTRAPARPGCVAQREAEARRVRRALDPARDRPRLVRRRRRHPGQVAAQGGAAREGAARARGGRGVARVERHAAGLAVEPVHRAQARAAEALAQHDLEPEAAARARGLGGPPGRLRHGDQARAIEQHQGLRQRRRLGLAQEDVHANPALGGNALGQLVRQVRRAAQVEAAVGERALDAIRCQARGGEARPRVVEEGIARLRRRRRPGDARERRVVAIAITQRRGHDAGHASLRGWARSAHGGARSARDAPAG